MARVCSLKRKAWANEQASLQGHLTANNNFKQPADFEKLDDEIIKKAISLEQVSSFIGEQKLSFESLKHFVQNEVENAFRLTDEQQLMLLTLACAKLLCDAPKLENWRSVAEIRYHSWEAEHWLEPALSYYAEHHNKLKSVTQLAHVILSALVGGELQPKSERNKGIVQKEADSWSRETEPLKEIWFGLRGSRDDFMPYQEFSPIFTLWYQDEPKGFIAALRPLNPYIAKSMLTIAGATFFSATSANWQKAMELVPCSFEEDGTYKNEYKSYLLPILLDAAYLNILEAKSHTNDEDYVIGLINDVVEVLTARQDYPAIVLRWGSWLERLALQDTDTHDKFESSSFVPNKLLYALACKLKPTEFIEKPAQDFESWEYWAYYAAMASHLYNGFIQEYNIEQFTADWQLDIYSWGNEEALRLIKRSFDYTYSRGDLPGKLAYQLAYPFTKTEKPAEEWINLWKNAHPLREIMQFGFKSDVYGSSYKEKHEASGLLVQLFLIGLALLDLLVTAPDKKQMSSIKQLFDNLRASLITQLYIETTINKEKWQSLYRHLAIRRVIWQGETESIFNEVDTPTLNDFVSYYHNDTYALATLLENILINLKSPGEFASQLQACNINMVELIEKVELLKLIDEKRYSLSFENIRQLVQGKGFRNPAYL